MGGRIAPRPAGILRLFFLLGILGWLWWFFRSYLIFVGLVTLIGGAFLSVLGMLYVGRRVTVRVELPKNRVEKRQQIPVLIRFCNGSRLFGVTAEFSFRVGNLFTESSEKKCEKLFVAPGRGAALHYTMDSRFAGLAQIETEALWLRDWFGLCALCAAHPAAGAVLIFPPEGPGEETEVETVVEDFPGEEELLRRGTDAQPSGEVREYIPGDELKNIHWKLTAKQRRTMVRERLAQGKDRVNVLLALGEDAQENDRSVEAVYGICGLLLKREYPVCLFFLARGQSLETRPLSEENDLRQALSEILSRRAGDGRGDVEAQFKLEHKGERYVLIRPGACKGVYIG